MRIEKKVMTSSDDQRLLDYFSWNSCVSDERKLFYVATPKVACTSVKWWFAELEGVVQAVQQAKSSSETDPELAIHDTLLAVAPGMFVRSPERLAQIKADGYFSFALVRNPYKRIFSAWQSKILLREPLQIVPYEGQDFVEHPIELMSDVTGAFECFLEYLYVHERDDFKDCHWTPQYDLLQPALFPYSAVSKIEDTAALDAALRAHLAEAYVSPFTTARANESMIPYLPEFISPRSKELIEELYSRDFEEYGYSKVIPPAKESFSQEQLTVALKGVELLRGRHQRMGEMRQCLNEQMADLLKDKEWLVGDRDTWAAFAKSKEEQIYAIEAHCSAQEADRVARDAQYGDLEAKMVAKEAQYNDLEVLKLAQQAQLEALRSECENLVIELDQSKKEASQLKVDLELSQAEISTRIAGCETFALKHKYYLAAYQFVGAISASLRKALRVTNKRNGA
ncbi:MULTISPECIES: sulfotransferase family 2 domain-containing protein [unclassified Pseudomonas]|uniref:sulfotransferase family 2 domain-containing protein n=1 Tax=unclassified Pseudomonas TaxID=196821 RepID=UPI002893824B|nr:MULTISPECIES: sulfotransferase family 2 domain-containing protein [unclassified Pseudomonas]